MLVRHELPCASKLCDVALSTFMVDACWHTLCVAIIAAAGAVLVLMVADVVQVYIYVCSQCTVVWVLAQCLGVPVGSRRLHLMHKAVMRACCLYCCGSHKYMWSVALRKGCAALPVVTVLQHGYSCVTTATFSCGSKGFALGVAPDRLIGLQAATGCSQLGRDCEIMLTCYN